MSALGTKPEPPRQLRERWRVAAPVQRVVALLRVANHPFLVLSISTFFFLDIFVRLSSLQWAEP